MKIEFRKAGVADAELLIRQIGVYRRDSMRVAIL